MVHKYYNGEGKVAVLVSPTYGTGWSSTTKDTNMKKEMMMNKHLVEYVIMMRKNNKTPTSEGIMTIWNKYFSSYPPPPLDGVSRLGVLWMEKNEAFQIRSMRGAEYIYQASDDPGWVIA